MKPMVVGDGDLLSKGKWVANAKRPASHNHLARGLLILKTSSSFCTLPQYPAYTMASVGATPIFTTSRPADAANKSTKPTCASYKDAYDAATKRRCRNALILSYAFSLLATIAFQLSFRMYSPWIYMERPINTYPLTVSPLGFLNWRTLLFSIGLFILTLPLLLIRYLMSSCKVFWVSWYYG